MPNIRSLLSPAGKLAMARAQIQAGAILLLNCPFAQPKPKDKFVVVAHVCDYPLLIVINSAINDYIKSRPYLKSCQVPILASDYTFLSRDSFADCSEVKSSMSRASIAKQISDDPSRFKGTLSRKTRSEIANAISGAPTVSREQIKLITVSLR